MRCYSQRQFFNLRRKNKMASPSIFTILLIISVFVFLVVGVPLVLNSSRTPITSRPLMNKSEQRLFALLRQIVRDMLPQGYDVMSQVSYGEFLRCKDRKTFWSFNAKRADFVIIDPETNPVAVVEYQGTGHGGRTAKSRADAAKRDRVKRRTLSAADVLMIEVPAKFDHGLVHEMLSVSLSDAGFVGGSRMPRKNVL